MGRPSLDNEYENSDDWAKRERELDAFREVLDEFLEGLKVQYPYNGLLTKGVAGKFRKFLNDKIDKGWRP